MKMPDELDRLLDDVMAPEAADGFREATLQTTLAALQHRKRRRSLARKTALLALPVVLAGSLWLLQPAQQRAEPQLASVALQSTVPAPAQFIPGTDIRLISDEELFALFPDRPLALIGPKGHQQLVFLDAIPDGIRSGTAEDFR